MRKINIWIGAIRPKTLPASIIPVIVGSSLALSSGKFDTSILWMTILCSLLIQIITNFFNELFDFKKGADSHDRVGPPRAVTLGLISPKTMKWVTYSLVGITFICGLYLVFKGGIVILIIGIISLLLAYAYTGGPFPIAYLGISEIFVFVFFGLVSVCGTYYLHTQDINIYVFIASIGPGLISTNILGVNNIRDIETDKLVGKNTLAVKIGNIKAKYFYVINNVLAFIVPVILFLISKNVYVLITLIALPLSISLNKQIFDKSGKELNSVLSSTGLLLVAYGILIAIGFYFQRG